MRYWPLLLTVAALAVYVTAGWFMVYSVHYAIGDALSRAEDARAVLYSRDPHLAAWGFVWFPGPVVAELPFMAVVSPLDRAVLAGPLSTATCGAITILVLVKLFRRLGLSEPLVAGLTVTYCLNPVIIFCCANGMSEASFYLSASVFLLGIVWWFQEGGPQPLILTSMGLAATMAIREEALVLVPMASALVAFRERTWSRRAKVATLVVLPGAFVFALWTFANWLIMGSPLFWYEGLKGIGPPPTNAPWLPAHRTLVNSVLYSLRYSWAFVPALFIVVPLLFLVVRTRRRRWELVTLVCIAALIPSLVAVLLPAGGNWGDPRYFASVTIFATAILGFAAREVATARRLPLPAKRLVSSLLVCLAALDAVWALRNDINPKTTQVEHEFVPFRSALGLPEPAGWRAAQFVDWQRFDDFMGPYLSRGQLIMVDTGTDFPAPLFSKYPRQWVINSDRDFQKLAENFSGQFQWLLQTPEQAGLTWAPEIEEALGSTYGGHWHATKNFGPAIGELYRWVPNRSLEALGT